MRIKELREAAGMTQVALAQAIGVTQGTIASWERGGCLPSVAKIPALAKILGCAIDDLFAKDEAG